MICESKGFSSMDYATLFDKLQEHEIGIKWLAGNEEHEKKKRKILHSKSNNPKNHKMMKI